MVLSRGKSTFITFSYGLQPSVDQSLQLLINIKHKVQQRLMGMSFVVQIFVFDLMTALDGQLRDPRSD